MYIPANFSPEFVVLLEDTDRTLTHATYHFWGRHVIVTATEGTWLLRDEYDGEYSAAILVPAEIGSMIQPPLIPGELL